MTHSALTLFKKVWHYARSFRVVIISLFLLDLLLTPIALLKPVPLKIIVDSAFGSHPLPDFMLIFYASDYTFTFQSMVWAAVILVVLIAILENLYNLFSWVLSVKTGEKLILNFRALLFKRVQQLSLKFHDQKGTSDSLYRIQYDTGEIRNLMINGIAPIISGSFKLLAMLYVMLIINWQFALFALAIVPPLIYLTRISSARLRERWAIVKTSQSRAMSVVHEVLSAIRVVKIFGQEEREEHRFVEESDIVVREQVRVTVISAIFYGSISMLVAGSTAFFIYLGANYVQSGLITLGELIIILTYLSQIFGPLQTISKSINGLQASLASVDRVFDLLEKEPEVKEHEHPVPIKRASGKITIENLSFAYSEKAPLVLKDFSVSIEPGQKIGVLGTTGAGKSTLISLLTRFYDPFSGRILLDGTDIRNYSLSDYRNQFGVVLQEPVLFSTSIAENIGYGRPNATKAKIIDAAKLANAHEFIMNCEKGYDTLVGERGMQLSGGERQRISIARAFIRDAPILILDEPTSAVDVGTEANIMEAVELLMEGRTSILITHRLDTLYHCDLLLHLEKGKQIEVIQHDLSRKLEEKITSFKNGAP